MAGIRIDFAEILWAGTLFLAEIHWAGILFLAGILIDFGRNIFGRNIFGRNT